jgi:nicotinate-nucleotide--dimethylbenzimidazole phosphoribosyltransferase
MHPAWFKKPIASPSESAGLAARKRLLQQAKAPGSLGRLELFIERLAALQGNVIPTLDQVGIYLFAGDHDTARNHPVTPFSPDATQIKIRQHLDGTSPTAILALQQGTPLTIIDISLAQTFELRPALLRKNIGKGSSDICQFPAINDLQFSSALRVGREMALKAREEGVQLFIGGQVGIGGNMMASAVATALLGAPAEAMAGPSDGLDEKGMAEKARVIQTALERHGPHLSTPLQTLRRLGGYELTALCGAFLACGQEGIPILLDDLQSAVAALVAVSVKPQLKRWLFFSHRSTQPGLYPIQTILNGQPFLELELQLGEGAGALMVLGILRAACTLNNRMDTFTGLGLPIPPTVQAALEKLA